MPLPTAYRLTGRLLLKEIVKQGLGSEFGAVWGELQWRPTDGNLGVQRLRGTDQEFPDGYFVRLGPHWLYYRVDESAHVVNLLSLVPIL